MISKQFYVIVILEDISKLLFGNNQLLKYFHKLGNSKIKFLYFLFLFFMKWLYQQLFYKVMGKFLLSTMLKAALNKKEQK